jgi:uncharacterized protein (TIGR03382 family)
MPREMSGGCNAAGGTAGSAFLMLFALFLSRRRR